jgi:hypothetical protein
MTFMTCRTNCARTPATHRRSHRYTSNSSRGNSGSEGSWTQDHIPYVQLENKVEGVGDRGQQMGKNGNLRKGQLAMPLATSSCGAGKPAWMGGENPASMRVRRHKGKHARMVLTMTQYISALHSPIALAKTDVYHTIAHTGNKC